MNNLLEYKGFFGNILYSGNDEVFHGEIIGINDHITFEGNSVKTLKKDFQEAVEDYLESCAELGKEPEKTYKGTFNIRINPELHKKLDIYSAAHNISLNSTVEEAIRRFIN